MRPPPDPCSPRSTSEGVPFPLPAEASRPVTRLRLLVRGLVQGVGFRPFIHRLAGSLGLAGFVRNTPSGAWIEVEGEASRIEVFRRRLRSECPPPAVLLHEEATALDPIGEAGFRIGKTEVTGSPSALVLPDLATCPDCLAEIRDPAARRFRYPFTNCTRCGPRFSILEELPYDRERTVMRDFALCPACRAEFEDPGDRRFHAQPIACPLCGPQVRLLGTDGSERVRGDAALSAAARALREGGILALKGIGGYQLMVRADDNAAVDRLRQRKHREGKPLAVMVASTVAAREFTRISDAEQRLLESTAAPIVLLTRRSGAAPGIAEAVAPGCPWLGLLLPCSPLHHLILAEVGLPVVATSGNRTDEPICLNEAEALERLGDIADVLLVHDRRIVRQVDDSVARVIDGHEQILRRARGYAPLPIPLPPSFAVRQPVLAVGAHLKNSIALLRESEVIPSQHIGDLETSGALAAFHRVVDDLPRLFHAVPASIAADSHPDYESSRYAQASGRPIARIPHHEAHAWSCLADNQLEPPALALAWDGTGLGSDGTIWGGEFLELTADTWECRRRGRLRPFRLPGGDAVARDPRRSLLGLLHGLARSPDLGRSSRVTRLLQHAESVTLLRMLDQGLNSPWSSSLGRLFDAVASGLGLIGRSRFEGEAAMQLEWAAWRAIDRFASAPEPGASDTGFQVISREDLWELDWRPWVEAHLGSPPDPDPDPERTAVGFHRALIQAAVEVVRRIGLDKVLLTGGCFQNRLLSEWLAQALRAAGFSVYSHQRVPPHDGGLAVGQAIAAAARAARRRGGD